MSGRLEGAVEVVFFDVGGTLLRARPSVGHVYAEVLGPFGRRLDPRAVDPRFEAAWARVAGRLPPGQDRFSQHPAGAPGFWRHLLDEMMSTLDEPALSDAEFEAVHAAFRSPSRYMLFADVVPVLEALVARGVRMGVISNWDERLPPLLAELGLAAYFGAVVTSGIERLEKPVPGVFAVACARMGVGAGRALHVGDSRRDDYEGARGAGLGALLLDRDGAGHHAGLGDHVIRSLTGVLDRVDGANGTVMVAHATEA